MEVNGIDKNPESNNNSKFQEDFQASSEIDTQ